MVTVTVRASLRYALDVGVLDACLVFFLTGRTPDEPLGALHGLALVFCSFMGGLTSTSLRTVKDRLAEANALLAARNAQLSETVAAQEAARLQQERAAARLDAGHEALEVVLLLAREIRHHAAS